jgi:hypothetical protein
MAGTKSAALSGLNQFSSCSVKATSRPHVQNSLRHICGPILPFICGRKVDLGVRTCREKNTQFGAGRLWVLATATDSATNASAPSASQKSVRRNAAWKARKAAAGKGTTRRGEDLDEGVFDKVVFAMTDAAQDSKAPAAEAQRPNSRGGSLASALASLKTRNGAPQGQARGGVKNKQQTNVGDPRGKRQLGKAVMAWLSEGMSKMSADLLDESSDLQARIRAPGFSLLKAAQPYLEKNAKPVGEESSCQVAAAHFSTLWDHLQREVRVVLEKEGDPEKNEVWQKVKALARRGVCGAPFLGSIQAACVQKI